MRNYTTYLKGMKKGNREKLFFLNKIDLNNYDTIIDFGCGKGDILKACADGKRNLIGIDCDPVMINYAKRNVPHAKFYSTLTKSMLNEKTLIIFSSVLHEIESYWTELEKILANTHSTVVVRDMRYTGADGQIEVSDWEKVVKKSNSRNLTDFIGKYRLRTQKDLYHWLLKYSYTDNWELELNENYFSFDYDKLFALGSVIYENNYTLGYKKKKVKKDFGINLVDGTHTQLIIRIN